MPVIGPGDNAIYAEKAYEKILAMLRNEHGIQPDQLCNPDMFEEEMKAELEKLRSAIKNIFRLDAWDGW